MQEEAERAANTGQACTYRQTQGAAQGRGGAVGERDEFGTGRKREGVEGEIRAIRDPGS